MLSRLGYTAISVLAAVFWEQHNESRLVVLRLLVVEAFTGRLVHEHLDYASVMMAALQTYLLVLLLGKSIRSAFIKWSTAVCIVAFPAPSPAGSGNVPAGQSRNASRSPSLSIVVGLFLLCLPDFFPVKAARLCHPRRNQHTHFCQWDDRMGDCVPIFPLLHELRDPSKDRRSISSHSILACLCGIFSIGSYFVDFSGTPISWPADGLAGFLKVSL